MRVVTGLILAVLLTTSLVSLTTLTVQAASPQQLACEGAGSKWTRGKCVAQASNGPTVPKTIQTSINILLYVIGITAVIVIVISAIRTVTSQGDSQVVAKARQAIIYTLIGVVVALSAFAIVNFVLDQL